MKFRLSVQPTTPTTAIEIRAKRVIVQTRPLRVLDFDCEARPLHWIANDYVSKEITAIAWAWSDRPDDVTAHLLGESHPIEMLEAFRSAYDMADVVTGHFIRGFDLPLINGAMTEYQLPMLKNKLSHDTKLDLIKRSGLSASQENLGAMLCLDSPKVKMDQRKWRSANRLTPEGLASVRERVTGDVRQHIEMRRRLIELGYLGPPKLWRSIASDTIAEYMP